MIPPRTLVFLFSAIVLISVMLGLNLASFLQHPDNCTRAVSLSQLSKSLQLTDLAIWTESRYTRHPSQADSFAAFQDMPATLEHFPAGSLVIATPSMMAFEPKDISGTTP